MKTGILRTIWIILTSFWYMADTCGRAIWKSLRGTITRQWCSEELQRWGKRMLALLRIHCTVINPHHIEPQQGKATILMCNHSSLFDIPLSLQAFPNHPIRMLAKKELSRIPIMGGGMVAAEFPFIDRKNRRQAIKDLAEVKRLLESGIVMWIAPEGTRSVTGKLGTFKKGGFITAIKTGATIIPIGIKGANHILPAHSHQFCLDQKAELHIGQPIDASCFDLDQKDHLITAVFEEMQQLLSSK
ncbi:MAG: 1-acyl-sn-glycerol-3-phosphate acyltransferase [Gammaproteobacteria bacterium]|nr:1-acyl-sn-glycerol-3-phosphate acyltransferase [Gammaproteobacteria bacterium]